MQSTSRERRSVLRGVLATGVASVAHGLVPRGFSESASRNTYRMQFPTWKYGMFLHFNMGTFTDREWATGYEDPDAFVPGKLSCAQWADAAASAGMKYAVLTAKHTGGWCLWPSAYTRHGVQSFRRFRNGKGDVVREYVDAFRSHGLKVGLYYCFPGDYASNPSIGHPIPEDKPDLHGLPAEAIGDYSGFMKKQLTELLAYRPDLLWIDQWENKYTRDHWTEILAHIHQVDPACLVLANNARSLDDSDVLSYEFPYKGELPAEGNHDPAEVSDCLQTNSRWFWHPGLGSDEIQRVELMAERYRLCRSRNANYCLDVPPDRDGLLPGEYVKRIRELAAVIGNG